MSVWKIFDKTRPWYNLIFLDFYESSKSSLKHHQWKVFVLHRPIFHLILRDISMDKPPLIRNFQNGREVFTHLSSLMKFSSAKFGVVPLTIWFKIIFGLIHITVRIIFLKSFAYHISPDRNRATILVYDFVWLVTLQHLTHLTIGFLLSLHQLIYVWTRITVETHQTDSNFRIKIFQQDTHLASLDLLLGQARAKSRGRHHQ